MHYKKITPFVFDCITCPTRCDGKSKGNYQFEDDVTFAELQEELIINSINEDARYTAQKCVLSGYPDVEILNIEGRLINYLEVKAQRRTFMSVERILPKSGLKPSETVVLNLSDLLRYFEIEETTTIPTSIVWVVSNRPCLVSDLPDSKAGRENKFYYQKISALRKIYSEEKTKRRFRRKSGEGDIVDGEHKGVVVNYHFSLNELREWNFKG